MEEIIERNPCRVKGGVNKKAVHEIKVLTPAQLGRYLDAGHGRCRREVRIGLHRDVAVLGPVVAVAHQTPTRFGLHLLHPTHGKAAGRGDVDGGHHRRHRIGFHASQRYGDGA